MVDGVLDPIAGSTGRGNEAATLPFSTRLQSDVGAQATLNEFVRLCDAGGANCAFSGDSTARYEALASRLRANPVPITAPDVTTGVLDYSKFIGITLGAMDDSTSWADFAGFLADVEHQASARTLGARAERSRGTPAYITKRGFPRYPNFVESFPPVACADSDNPGSYTGPFNHHTANPVLVVGNLFDPATPYQGAQTVHALLPDSALLTVHGWGHTSLFLSACADEAITRYLVDRRTPAPGTVCEQDVVPFSGP